MEFDAFHSVEAISEVRVDDFWVVSVGKNIEESLVGNEIESREDLFLLFQIIIQGFLALFDF